VIVMAIYAAGQALLAAGLLGHAGHSAHADDPRDAGPA